MSGENKTNNNNIGFAPSGSAAYPGYPPENPPLYSGPPPQYSATVIQQGPTVVHHGPTMVHHGQHPTIVQPGSVTMVSGGGATAILVSSSMGQQPTVITCRSCNQNIVTRVEMKPTLNTHLFALLLCVFGCWPCVCIPYCVDSCNSAEHYCPHCHAYIGSSTYN